LTIAGFGIPVHRNAEFGFEHLHEPLGERREAPFPSPDDTDGAREPGIRNRPEMSS
jgi:hypothetical protein